MSHCLSPVVIRKERRLGADFFYNKVPCGKCLHCKRRRVQHWLFRLKQELKISNTATFVTLTYDDDNLPYGAEHPTLDKKDFQDFLKRLRKYVDTYYPSDYKIKYYGCGEYGSKTKRPHYHAIMFNIPNEILEDSQKLQARWKKGFIRLDPVNDATISYVLKYIEKDSSELPSDVLPEFSLMSKKMGLNYISDKKKEFYNSKQIPYLIVEDGKKMSMPRYYKDKIYDEDTREKISIQSLSYIADKQDLTFDQKINIIEVEKRRSKEKRDVL